MPYDFSCWIDKIEKKKCLLVKEMKVSPPAIDFLWTEEKGIIRNFYNKTSFSFSCIQVPSLWYKSSKIPHSWIVID